MAVLAEHVDPGQLLVGERARATEQIDRHATGNRGAPVDITDAQGNPVQADLAARNELGVRCGVHGGRVPRPAVVEVSLEAAHYAQGVNLLLVEPLDIVG